jgi:transposase
MRKERKHFTPEEKVAILRRLLVDRVPVSELCEELGLRPTVFYRWQKELFEDAEGHARRASAGDSSRADRKLDAAKEQRKSRRQRAA